MCATALSTVGVDVIQVQPEHEAVVGGDASPECFEQFGASGLDAADVVNQCLRVGLASMLALSTARPLLPRMSLMTLLSLRLMR